MIPGSVEAWPASLTTSSFASGQARCSAQAPDIGVTTSNRPWAIQHGMWRMRPMFFSSQPSSGKKPPLVNYQFSIRAKATANSGSANLSGLASGPWTLTVSPSQLDQATAQRSRSARSSPISRL